VTFRLPRLLPAILLLVILPAPPLAAQGSGQISYERFTLPNGLDVVMAPDPTTDVAAVDLWYFVGSRDETAATAGLARLFDRLMFAGSTHVPPGGHATMLELAGGRVTAAVEEDVSRFSETIPATTLPQALWLEADRMRGVVLNDTTVNGSRLAFLTDLRARLSAEPYTGVILESVAALYDSTSCPGYGRSPVNRAVASTTLDGAAARAFFSRFYRPNNARLVISGNFDPTATRVLVTSYFSEIPRGADPARSACSGQASSVSPRRTVTDPTLARAAAGIFYRIPAPSHEDTPALELLGVVLGQGTGSRLTTALMRETAAASSIQAGPLGSRTGPGAFGLFAVAAQGVTADSLVRLLGAQASWATSDGITPALLERAKNIYRATAVSRRERPLDLADELQQAATYRGSLQSVNLDVEQVMGLTPDDLRRVASRWLRADNSLTVLVTPGATP
jgi:zinc protease